MVSQIVSVASYFVCWLVATRFGSLVAPTIPLEAPWDQVVAMAVVFLVTFVAIRFARTALEKLIKDWHLEKLNKLLGGILGFTKGLLICLIITFFAVMLSETSRAVVFNSKSGSHLVQLITRIGLFVPKDSYEFVHTQFANFQSKVDGAIPGQTPDALPVQSSETVQKMFAQLGKTEPRTGSLLTALSQLWKGSGGNSSEPETVISTPQTAQSVQSVSTQSVSAPPLAVPYTSQAAPLPTSVLPVAPATQPATSKPAVAVDDFFTRQTTPSVTPVVQQMVSQPLAALSPMPEIPVPSLSPVLSPLTALSPVSEILPAPLKSSHVGSDLLLRNSGKTTNPNASAHVFRSQ